jgi:hypothetical protein
VPRICTDLPQLDHAAEVHENPPAIGARAKEEACRGLVAGLRERAVVELVEAAAVAIPLAVEEDKSGLGRGIAPAGQRDVRELETGRGVFVIEAIDDDLRMRDQGAAEQCSEKRT